MLTSIRSSTPCRYTFSAEWNALLPLNVNIESRASVLVLAPLYFRRRIARPVSCYAFFKGWLLLSQPPNCLRKTTLFEFTLSLYLRALIIVWVFSLLEQRLTPRPLLWTS